MKQDTFAKYLNI